MDAPKGNIDKLRCLMSSRNVSTKGTALVWNSNLSKLLGYFARLCHHAFLGLGSASNRTALL